jgi:Na+-transporting NADH:ubiquinone oxidoreductase subunit NqrD
MTKLVLILIIAFTCFNLVISGLMEYAAIQIGKRCPCMKRNYHWNIIVSYFAISCVFLAYLLYHFLLKKNRRFAVVVIALYTACTVVFIASGFALTINPKKSLQSCQCDMKEFDTILFFITLIRTIMTALTILTMILLYVVYLFN